jgi:hypothetical protein
VNIEHAKRQFDEILRELILDVFGAVEVKEKKMHLANAFYR